MGLERRLAELHRRLVPLADGGLGVAFSGGVDSSVLLHAAHAALGERALGVIADSPSLPRAELQEARVVARQIGIELVVLGVNEFEREGYRRNQGLRCYWCRHTLFERMEQWARDAGVGALAYGEILDDRYDDRPGRRAAREFQVLAPLAEAGLSKEDVRAYARRHGLSVAEKPAMACLASRVPVGTEVTVERLAYIERAESLVGSLGFDVLRVRDHGRRARVEVGAGELDRARQLQRRIAGLLEPLGVERVELAAYRSPGRPERGAPSALEDGQQPLG